MTTTYCLIFKFVFTLESFMYKYYVFSILVSLPSSPFCVPPTLSQILNHLFNYCFIYMCVCVYVCNVCVYTYTLLSPFSVIPVHMYLGLTIWDLINLSGGLCLEKTDSLTLNSH